MQPAEFCLVEDCRRFASGAGRWRPAMHVRPDLPEISETFRMRQLKSSRDPANLSTAKNVGRRPGLSSARNILTVSNSHRTGNRAGNRPTLRDVAEVAGLSVTQTSRALNGHDDVAAATRSRALAAAEKVGYRPNLEARRLKMPDARAQSIGLVLSSPEQRFSDPFLGVLLTAIVSEAAVHDFEVQLSTPVHHDEILTVYQRAIQSKRVDGFIILRVESDDLRVRYLLDNDVPFVTLGRPQAHSGFASVSESSAGLESVVRHLAELGHRSIGVVGLPAGYAMADIRLAAFMKAMETNGLAVDRDLVVNARGYYEDDGAASGAELLQQGTRPTAIIAFNDLLAVGVARAAGELGLAIPDDLSVVAVDDTIMARNSSPPLTALRNPAEEYGRGLVVELLAAVEEGLHDRHGLVVPELVIRSSTGPPRSS